MAPKLYMSPASPPVRCVLMVAKAIGLELEFVNVDVTKGENRTPEYLKLNPQHTIPTLVDDDGSIIWDSHAIITYLVSKYAEDDGLYPKDLKKRAVIDQRLYFDSGVLWPKGMAMIRPIVYFRQKTIDNAAREGVEENFAFLEEFLEGKQWIAGDSVSVADYSIISSIAAINHDFLAPVDEKRFPRLTAWIKRCEDLPAYEANREGLAMGVAYIRSILEI